MADPELHTFGRKKAAIPATLHVVRVRRKTVKFSGTTKFNKGGKHIPKILMRGTDREVIVDSAADLVIHHNDGTNSTVSSKAPAREPIVYDQEDIDEDNRISTALFRQNAR